MNKELLQEMKKMTLRQVLDKLPSDYIVKVGCGSGFFYCYYNNQLAKTRIEKESASFTSDYQRFLLKRTIELKNLDRKTKSAINRINKLKRMSANQKTQEIALINEKYEHDKETLPKVIENLKKKINSFTPLLDRQVINAYQLNMDTYQKENTIYLVLSGNGIGRYNDYDEYAKAHHLPLDKEDNKWAKILTNRKVPRKKADKTKKLVKKKKNTQYKVLWDNDGQAIGLVERN